LLRAGSHQSLFTFRFPPDASVAASEGLNPHLSERQYITVFPTYTYSIASPKGTLIKGILVQYIIVDTQEVFPEDQVSMAAILNHLINPPKPQKPQYSILLRAEGTILLVRNSTNGT
jgi:hypothetical protein